MLATSSNGKLWRDWSKEPTNEDERALRQDVMECIHERCSNEKSLLLVNHRERGELQRLLEDSYEPASDLAARLSKIQPIIEQEDLDLHNNLLTDRRTSLPGEFTIAEKNGADNRKIGHCNSGTFRV